MGMNILTQKGAKFRKPPPTYYTLEGKVEEIEASGENPATLQELGILVDAEYKEPKNKFQIFEEDDEDDEDNFLVTLSPPLLSARLSVTSRRSFAMLLLTLNRRCPLPLPPPPSRSLMSFPTARLSPLEMNVSVAQRLSSSHHSSEWKLAGSTRPHTTPS